MKVDTFRTTDVYVKYLSKTAVNVSRNDVSQTEQTDAQQYTVSPTTIHTFIAFNVYILHPKIISAMKPITSNTDILLVIQFDDTKLTVFCPEANCPQSTVRSQTHEYQSQR